MDKNKIEKMKAEVLDHIRNTPPEVLHQELIEAGIETYKDTPNVVSGIGEPFDFSVYKGWVSGVVEDGYEVKLISMINTAELKSSFISNEIIYDSDDEIEVGSIFMLVTIPDLDVQSVIFQKHEKPTSPKTFEEIAQVATQTANQLKEKENGK